MKFVTYDDERVGVIRGDEVVDLTDLLDAAPAWPPVRMVRFIATFESLRPDIDGRLRDAAGVPLDQVRLGAPVSWPNKLIAFPANYQRHIDEMESRNRADVNAFFLMSPSSLCGPNDEIELPDVAGVEMHHECELAVVIGRGGRHIRPQDALEHVFGFSCLIDVTIRGPQERVARKSFDSFTPLGPWLVTRDEIADPSGLDLELSVNGEVRQRSNTRELLLGIEDMIAMSAAITTLEPGDVIATGTPDGVGVLVPGDEVTITIQDVGSMTLPVRSQSRPSAFTLPWGINATR